MTEPSGSRPAIPDRAADDSDAGWGEPPYDEETDRALLDERPPHHEPRD